MSGLWAVARREWLAYFTTPVGYVVIALYLVISGILFMVSVMSEGQPATMRTFFDTSGFMLLFIAPAISMRLVAEELRLGTLESLMTCPVSDGQVVFGKWLGAVGFFIIMLIPTLLFVVSMEIYSNPDYGSIVSGYIGLLLVGGLYLALGTLASTFGGSQVLAYLIALFFWLAFWGLTTLVPVYLPQPWSEMLYWMSVGQRLGRDFGKGVFDLSSAVYFVSGMVFFLVLAVKVLESRRWR